MPEKWPTPTPRDQLLARVVSRGKRIRLMRRLLAAAAVGGIAVAGVAGYAMAASDTIDVLGEGTAQVPDATAAYYACPDEAAIGELHRGDRVFITGQTEDGSWLEVRSPIDLLDRAWVQASIVTPDASVDLPVVECGLTDEELALATGEVVVDTTTTTSTSTSTTVVGETTTTTAATTTTTAEPQSEPNVPPTTPPTVPPTNPQTPPTVPSTTAAPAPAPTLGTISRSETTIWEDWASVCASRDHTSLISVPVQNATSVTLQWNVGPQPRSKPMSVQGGVASAHLGPFDETAVDDPTVVTVTVRAVGAGGQTTRQTTVTLQDCYFG